MFPLLTAEESWLILSIKEGFFFLTKEEGVLASSGEDLPSSKAELAEE